MSLNIQVSALRESYGKFTSQKLSPKGQKKVEEKTIILHLNQVMSQFESASQAIRKTRDTGIKKMQLRVKRRVNTLIEIQIGARKCRSSRAME